MRRATTVAALGLAGALLALTAGACGSGGGGAVAGTVDPLGLLSGTYHTVIFSGSAGPPTDEGRATWGTVGFDGAGMTTGTGSLTANENGVVTGPTPNSGILEYGVDAQRHAWIDFGGSPVLFGGVTADGNTTCMASLGNDPQILIAGRSAGTFSNATLTGPFHCCAFGYNQGTLTDRAWWGSFTFDGSGGGTSSMMLNANGAIATYLGPGPTYTVAPDGAVTATLVSLPLAGRILTGGELVILGGQTAGGYPVVMVLMRGSTGATNASLNGLYHTVGMSAGNAAPPDTWVAAEASFTADGAGTLTLGAFSSNADGSVVHWPALGGTTPYSVAANGALTFGAGDYLGGVSPSGRYAMFAGDTVAGDDPEFWFMLR